MTDEADNAEALADDLANILRGQDAVASITALTVVMAEVVCRMSSNQKNFDEGVLLITGMLNDAWVSRWRFGTVH